MKKIKLGIVMLLCFSLMACSSTKTTTCTMEGSTASMKIQYDGSNVKKITTSQETNVSELDYTEAELKEAADSFAESVNSTSGYEYSYTIKDGVFTQTITITIAQVDLDQLVTDGFILEDNIKTNSSGKQYIDYETFLSSLKSSSYTCK